MSRADYLKKGNGESLVYLVSRLKLKEQDAKQIKKIIAGRGLDWDYIIEFAGNRGLAHLLYYHMHRLRLESYLPQGHVERLKKGYYLNSAGNLAMLSETKRIINAFNAEGVKSIILKGVLLAEHIYKNIALRPIGDIDILIKKEDLARVNKVLSSLGYISPPNYQDFLDTRQCLSLNSLIYRRPDKASGSFLHLHWHIINSSWLLEGVVRKIDMEQIWSSSETTALDGIPTRMLSAEHLLIYLSQHAFMHRFQKLILLCDISENIEFYKERINWNLLFALAEKYGLSLMVSQALASTQTLLKTPMPAFEGIRPHQGQVAYMVSRLFAEKYAANYFVFGIIYFFMQKSLREKFRFLARLIIPQPLMMTHHFSLPANKISSTHYYRYQLNLIRAFLSLT